MRLYITIALLLIVPITWGQDAEDTTYSLSDLYIDYAVPDISAFSLLNISGEEILRPGNMRQFSAGLANFLSYGENIQPGFAMELSPKNFGKKREDEWWTKDFRWDNFAFSVASSGGDSLGIMLAGGVKWVPLDRSDPHADADFYREVLFASRSIIDGEKDKFRKDNDAYEAFVYKKVNGNLVNMKSVLDNAFKFEKDTRFYEHQDKLDSGKIENPIQFFSDGVFSAFKAVSVDLTAADSNEIIEYASKYEGWLSKKSYLTKTKEKISALKALYKKNNWYKGAFMVSGGIVGNSLDQKYESLKFRNFSAIISGSFGFELKKWKDVNAQLILQGRADGALIDTVEFDNRFSFGGRLLVGSADNRLSIEALYSSSQLSKDNHTAEFDQIRFFQYSAGVELKLTKGTWLELAIGGQRFFEGDSGTAILPSFGFKHDIQTKRRF